MVVLDEPGLVLSVHSTDGILTAPVVVSSLLIGFEFHKSDDQVFCLTVLDDVVFGPLNLGRSPQEANQTGVEILNQVGISGIGNRITYRRSVGEKRLVAFACLSMRPRVLFLDEPTSGLDRSSELSLSS